MKLKHLLMKTLFVAVGLCVGQSVWADVTPYSNDYEDATPNVDWVSANTGRYTVGIEGSTDHYLHVGAVGTGDNGTTITCSATSGKVTAGTDFYMSFDLVLDGCNTSGKHSIFYIFDKNNNASTPILKIYQNDGSNYTTWTVNNNTALTTGGKGTGNWYNYVLTRIGTKEYLTVTKKSNSSKVLDMVEITSLSTNGGLGNMQFATDKYYAGMYIDNVVVRALDAPAFTLSTTEVNPGVGDNAIVDVTGITGTVSVSSDNTSAATASYSDGKITINGVANGVAYITVTAVNDGAKTTKTITATVGALSTTDITVNYLCGSTTIASPLVIEDVAVGSILTASDITYDEVIYGSGVRYVNPTPDQTIPYTVVDNGVINISYTSQAAVTNVKKIVKAGGVTVSNTNVAQDGKYVGDVIYMSFPAYINYNGTLYNKASNGNPQNYRQSFTLTENNQECVLAYSATAINNIVYYSEAESVTGATATSDGNNMLARSSNQACAYAESNIALTTLPAGKYTAKMIVYSNSSAGATLHFDYDKAYDAVVSGSSNWSEQTYEFTLTNSKEVRWLTSGDSKNGLDLIYIQKAGEVATLNSAGLASFSSAYPLDLDNITGATAYYAKNDGLSKGKVTLTEATGSVAAGEGLILRGENGAAVTIPVAATGTAIDGNLMVGCPTAQDITASTEDYAYIYVLGASDAQLHNVKDYVDTHTTLSIPAGKAYLKASIPSGARSLTICFDDEDVTGVNEVRSQKEDVRSEWFDLQGRKVAQPAKGLYIVNGKKVVIK